MANEYMSAQEIAALSEKPLAELEEIQMAYNRERVIAKGKASAVQAIIEAKINEAEAMRKFERMSPSEREALAQIIAANGIPSNGAVGTPGH